VVKYHNFKKAIISKTKAQSKIFKRKELPKKLFKKQECFFFTHKKYKNIYNSRVS